MKKRIGILTDATHENFGDKAIAAATLQVLEDDGIDAFCLPNPPTSTLLSKCAAVVVGGGHLLHHSGHPFYDQFRLPGRHILNAVGISGDADGLEYLSEYRYVAVRSNLDRKILGDAGGDAAVAPCMSMGMRTVLPPISSSVPKITSGAVLVHACSVMDDHIPDWLDRIEAALPETEKVLLSATAYNGDAAYLESHAARRGLRLMKGLCHHEIAGLISHPLVAGVVSMSLHVSIFAWRESKRFLVFPSHEKITAFLADRDALNHLWTPDMSASAIRDRWSHQNDTAGWRKERLRQDLEAVAAHRRRVVEACREAVS